MGRHRPRGQARATRRRTAGGLALLLAAAGLVSAWPAQAATWLEGVSVSDPTRDVLYVEDPVVVLDADGTATTIWQSEGEIEAEPFEVDLVQTATREAGAADYGSVQELGEGVAPDLIAHPDGSITAAWQRDGTVWTATRPPDAAAFPAAQALPDLPDGSAATPRLAVDGAGNVTMVFVQEFADESDSRLWSTTRPVETGAWTEALLVPESDHVSGFDVEAAPDGTVTVAWGSESARVWWSARPSGGTLSDPRPVDPAEGFHSHVALTDNAAGLTALSWKVTGSPEADLRVALRAESKDLFGADHGLSGDDPLAGDVALVVDDAGRVAGGWLPAKGGVVGVTRATDGTVMTTPIVEEGIDVPKINAAVDQRGAVTLAWQQGAGSFFVAASHRPAGAGFESPVNITDIADGRANDPVLGVAPSGDVTLVYAYFPEDGPETRHIRSRVLDVNPPSLTATVPATGTAGTAAAMTASASDLWSPVSVTWDFGDGSTATGASASHAYAAAGSYDVRVTATDGSGNATSRTRTVTVAASAAAPPADRTAPVLARVRLAPGRLPTGHGAKLRLTSTEAGRLVGVVERRRPNGHWRAVGAKSWSLRAGRSAKTFYGKVAEQRLQSGRHRVRLVATDAAGNPSTPVVVRFRVDRG